MLSEADRALAAGAIVHGAIALVCAAALTADLPAITGVHPALKPFKFALSIALVLGTMALLVPALDLSPAWRRALVWVLLGTLGLEMALIALQAARGTTSHFNLATPFDSVVWRAMGGAITAAMLGFIAIAVIATLRPLAVGSALAAFAWRAALWVFLLSAVSGYAMGGRSRHSVGGEDGGPGLPLVNWSTTHGDLRVPHFLAMHALQALPLAAALIATLPLAPAGRWAALVTVVAGYAAVALWTLVRALGGLPLV